MLYKSTFIVTFFTFVVVGFNFVSQLIIAFYFGVSHERDAFFAASVLPTYIIATLYSSLIVILMSVYTKFKIKAARKEEYLFISNVMNLTTLVLGIFILICYIFSNKIITYTSPGFDLSQSLLTARLFRITLPGILFLTLANIITTIFQAEGNFLVPALAPLLNIIVSILFLVTIGYKFGIVGVAFGNLLGAFINFLFLFIKLLQKKMYLITLKFRDAEIANMIKLAMPLLLTGIFFKSTSVFERLIASRLETGSISYLGYANQLVSFLSMGVSIGISTTIFPLITKFWEEGNLEKMKAYLYKSVIYILCFAIPVSFFLFIYADVFVAIVYKRGAFHSGAVSSVSITLIIMLGAFINMSLGNVVAKVFYITHKTKVYAVIALIEYCMYLGLGFYLSSIFSFRGLAAALSISSSFNIITSLIYLNVVLNNIQLKKMMLNIILITVASLAVAAASYGIKILIGDHFNNYINFAGGGIVAMACYLVVILYVVRLKDARELQQKLLGIIKNRIIAKTHFL